MGRPVVLLAALLALVGAVPLAAQISPGELSAAHAELEGSGGCLRCHAQRKGVDEGLCLDCHELLRERIEAGLGLHARPEYEACAGCHIEHHGRDFELVWWGEAGESAFDHRLTGHQLVGAHRQVSCRDCHRSESVTRRAELESHGKQLDRTFLGLETSCLSCHRDEHRGQVAADSCRSCHTQDSWLPAALFDHRRARFALTGRHLELGCDECHGRREVPGAGGESYLELAVATFAGRCVDCHRDSHQGRLGSRCGECHDTGDWRAVDHASFDHDRTRFRLLGRHRETSCRECHRPGEAPGSARFEGCIDCHADRHDGQFAGRPGGGAACEPCHDVQGFRPSSFGIAEHQGSDYPLEQAHLAVPCDACHRPVAGDGRAPGDSRPAVRNAAGGSVTRFRFASTACHDCHRDAHRGEVRELVENGGCESCHSLAGWRVIELDHDRTGYPLRGPHQGPVCGDCHERTGAAPSGEATLRLASASPDCGSCHGDPHAGQFSSGEGATECSGCHRVTRWPDLLFDHQVDSGFTLEGAHRQVECRECHRWEKAGERLMVRFKPLSSACESCHTGARAATAGAPDRPRP